MSRGLLTAPAGAVERKWRTLRACWRRLFLAPLGRGGLRSKPERSISDSPRFLLATLPCGPGPWALCCPWFLIPTRLCRSGDHGIGKTGGRELAHLVVMCDLAAARPARTDLCPSIPLASDLPACAVGFLMPALDIQRPTLPGTAYMGPGREDRDPTGRRCWKLRMDPPALHGPSTASPDAPVPPRIPAVSTSVPAGETAAKDRRGGEGVDKGRKRKCEW